MRDFHLWNLLGLQVPNPLPYSVFGSQFPRPAGRLIWSTVMFVAGLLIALYLIRKPKKSNEPATWTQTFIGAFFVWIMLTLGYGVIPSEWIIFGNSYLNFDSSTFLLRKDQFASSLPPFDVTRDKLVDAVAGGIYIIVLVINVWLFVAWQKRKVAEAATDGENAAVETDAGGGGVFARLRRPKRTSAYGRPVTTASD
jgi:hypothetical protein